MASENKELPECEDKIPKVNEEKDFPVFSDQVMKKFLRNDSSGPSPHDSLVNVVNYIKDLMDEFLKFDIDDMLCYDEHFVMSGIKSIGTRIKTYLKCVYNIQNEEICNYKT
jgi:hypothetical protein